MSTVLKRFDCTNGRAQHCYGCYTMTQDAEGDYVLAQDAYDKVAVLEAQITTLKTQLKDSKEVYASLAASFKAVGNYFDGRILYAKNDA